MATAILTSTRAAAGAAGPLSIEYRAPADLKPDPGNARTHSKKQIKQISSSITEFGFCNPVLVDEESVVIAGHGRLLAAKSLSLHTIPVITLIGLSDAQKRALRLADNKIAQNAGWDTDQVKAQLSAITLSDINFCVELTGFSTAEVDIICSPAAVDPDDEDIPAIPNNPTTTPGDVWELDNHRIGCSDVRDAAFMAKLMAGGAADAAFLDPPYNVKIQGHANVRSQHAEFAMASGEMSDIEFTKFLTDATTACAQASRDGAVHFICMDWRHLKHLQQAGDGAYGALLNMCIWNKSNAGMGSLYRSKHEIVCVYRVGNTPHFNAVELGRHGRNRTNVWDYQSVNTFKGSRRQDLDMHPTVKPIALVSDAIKDVTRRGEIVLDAFLGSGTTLLACEYEGRICRGADIDPGYVDVAIARWSAMTGRVAKLVQPPPAQAAWGSSWGKAS